MTEQKHECSMPAKWARSLGIGLAVPLGVAVYVSWQVLVIYALVEQIRHIG